jgi:hypothetical protein
VAVVMRASLGVGMNRDRTSPQFFSPNTGKINRGSPVHAGCLRGVGIKVVASNHTHAIVFPSWLGGIMCMHIIVTGVMLMGMVMRVIVIVIVITWHFFILWLRSWLWANLQSL